MTASYEDIFREYWKMEIGFRIEELVYNDRDEGLLKNLSTSDISMMKEFVADEIIDNEWLWDKINWFLDEEIMKYAKENK